MVKASFSDSPKDSRRLTMDQVAKLAGVSIGTVTRVVNDSDKVHPKTKDRIRKLIAGVGHRRICFCSTAMYLPTVGNRFTGYKQALMESGIPIDEALCVNMSEGVEQSSREALNRALESPGPPTAVFAENDPLAIACIHFVRRRGLRVPRRPVRPRFRQHLFHLRPRQAAFDGPTAAGSRLCESGRHAARLDRETPGETRTASGRSPRYAVCSRRDS